MKQFRVASLLLLPVLLGACLCDHEFELPASYVVFTEGTTFSALNGHTGAIDFSSTDAATIIRQAVAGAGRVFIRKGIYTVTSPIELPSSATLEMESGAILQVPNGYDRYVLGFSEGVRNARIVGGEIRETGDPRHLWQAVRLRATNLGVAFNTVRDTVIRSPDIAIKLLIDGAGGWINGNEFKSLRIYGPNVFIDFDAPSGAGEGRGFNRNYFEDILGQSRPDTRWGARNVRHQANVFVDVKFWDLHPGAVSATIHPDASDTLILGGIMTYRGFNDEGRRTQIIDPWRHASLKDVRADQMVIGADAPDPGYLLDVEGKIQARALDVGDITFRDPKSQRTLWRLFENPEGLYLENARSERLYRFVLEEVTTKP